MKEIKKNSRELEYEAGNKRRGTVLSEKNKFTDDTVLSAECRMLQEIVNEFERMYKRKKLKDTAPTIRLPL